MNKLNKTLASLVASAAFAANFAAAPAHAGGLPCGCVPAPEFAQYIYDRDYDMYHQCGEIGGGAVKSSWEAAPINARGSICPEDLNGRYPRRDNHTPPREQPGDYSKVQDSYMVPPDYYMAARAKDGDYTFTARAQRLDGANSYSDAVFMPVRSGQPTKNGVYPRSLRDLEADRASARHSIDVPDSNWYDDWYDDGRGSHGGGGGCNAGGSFGVSMVAAIAAMRALRRHRLKGDDISGKGASGKKDGPRQSFSQILDAVAKSASRR
ncbi:hypothetical protein FACS1894186_8630 [Alphaproteobacteria bacterium]|nr:hypothetical protein FACS1894186_8630 [Alphaproteobacteria bacterium]